MNFQYKIDSSPEFFQQILLNINAGIMTCDKDLSITFSNGRIKEVYGLPDDSDVKDWSKHITIYEPDGITPLTFERLPLVRALRGEFLKDSYNIVVSQKRGRFLIKTHANPIFDKEGNISGSVLTSLDCEDLMNSISRFQSIFDQSPLSIQILDKSGKSVAVNNAYKKLWDLSDEFVNEFILKKYNMLEDPELARNNMLDTVKKAFAGETVQVPEFLYNPQAQKLDGRARWASGIMYPLKNANGEVTEVVIIHQDQTDEHNALAEKNELLSLLKAIVKQMPAGLMVSNQAGKTILYNDQMTNFIGDADTAQTVLKDLNQKSLNGETIHYQEIEYSNDKKNQRVIATSSAPIHDANGNITASVVIADDITLDKRIQRDQNFLTQLKSLLISTLDFDQILELITHSAIPYVADGIMVDIIESHKIDRIVSHHRDPELQVYMKKMQEEFPPTFNSPQPTLRAIKSGQTDFIPVIDKETILKNTFSETHAQYIQKIGIHGHIAVPLKIRGKIIGAINLFRGAEGPKYEESDVVVAEELARYAALAIDNGKLYKDAKSSIELRDDFISIASHELRTPITLNLQIEVLNNLMKDFPTNPNVLPDMQKFLGSTNKQLYRLTRLVDDMLDISRISLGKLKLNLKEVCLKTLVLEVIERFKDQLRELKIEIFHNFSDETLLFCDPDKLDQVITNFMTNAIRYGGNRPITIDTKLEDSDMILKFKDQGRGIKKEDLGRIFNRFERIHTAQDVSGLGLGLYINKQIIQEHGGQVLVESSEQGSVFTVILPRNGQTK